MHVRTILIALASTMALGAVPATAQDLRHSELRLQLQDEQNCEPSYYTNVRIRGDGREIVAARAHCWDGRAFDAVRSDVWEPFVVRRGLVSVEV